ncbi:WhiB family transcriptional regulator [Rhodococcus globerulus]|uniref:Transcriptional regulator WhiB n=1 Tax=Rhodococcus globerulus TaxID=33008 RepID=A0ABU4BS54_RHOGO|nr:WhiB family transcriptional regulator [Rhodococcus globerulus]MDV6267046.1 WhiB family transcriptional regulator [Rhodococcus globerulus]
MSSEIDWRARAKCRDHDPELWFPNATVIGKRIVEAEAAVMVCLACPVRADCLQWATETGETWAIAGGKDFGAHGKHAAIKSRRTHASGQYGNNPVSRPTEGEPSCPESA